MRQDPLSLTRLQYDAIMEIIWSCHRFGGLSGKQRSEHDRGIKYVHPTFDMRDGRCFTITFRGASTPVDGLTFDFRDETRPMYDRIMGWLNGEEVPQRTEATESTALPSPQGGGRIRGL